MSTSKAVSAVSDGARGVKKGREMLKGAEDVQLFAAVSKDVDIRGGVCGVRGGGDCLAQVSTGARDVEVEVQTMSMDSGFGGSGDCWSVGSAPTGTNLRRAGPHNLFACRVI